MPRRGQLSCGAVGRHKVGKCPCCVGGLRKTVTRGITGNGARLALSRSGGYRASGWWHASGRWHASGWRHASGWQWHASGWWRKRDGETVLTRRSRKSPGQAPPKRLPRFFRDPKAVGKRRHWLSTLMSSALEACAGAHDAFISQSLAPARACGSGTFCCLMSPKRNMLQASPNCRPPRPPRTRPQPQPKCPPAHPKAPRCTNDCGREPLPDAQSRLPGLAITT